MTSHIWHAFFHPKYQINIISELLEVISKGFEKEAVKNLVSLESESF